MRDRVSPPPCSVLVSVQKEKEKEEEEEDDDDNEADFIALEEKPRSLGNY